MSAALAEAIGRHETGRLADAEIAYRTLAESAPPEERDAALTARQLLALLLAETGRSEEALGHYDLALAAGAASPELHIRRARLLLGLGRAAEAAAGLEPLCDAGSPRAEAHQIRAAALARVGRTLDAIRSYDDALRIDPLAKSVWNNRGAALESLGRPEEALESYDRALEIEPGYAQALHNRGSALIALGRDGEAVVSLQAALTRSPLVAESWGCAAVALARLGAFTEALASAEEAARLRPNYPEAHNTRSAALRALGRAEEAQVAAERALELRPGFAQAWNSLGSALARLGRPAAAIKAYRRALEHLGGEASVHVNLGLALEMDGQIEAALEAFAEAERLDPAKPEPVYTAATALIRAGRLRDGFTRYEARWLQDGGPVRRYPDETLWLGEPPLGERTLLVHAEQGFGDVIQFCRFAGRAAAPQRLILEVQPALKRLLHGLGGARVLAVGEEPPPFDAHIPMMSLPLALGLELEDVTSDAPYLKASRALTAEWSRRLPPAPGLRVGLAWSGNPRHENDLNRSLSLAALLPFLRGTHQYVSLQKGVRDEDEPILAGSRDVLDVRDGLYDFAETAALIGACDVVLSVDTSVAHLAGALGKPLLLLLPWFCDWRWMSGRADTPWYPSARLFRQTRFGDWSDALGAAFAALEARSAGAERRG